MTLTTLFAARLPGLLFTSQSCDKERPARSRNSVLAPPPPETPSQTMTVDSGFLKKLELLTGNLRPKKTGSISGNCSIPPARSPLALFVNLPFRGSFHSSSTDVFMCCRVPWASVVDVSRINLSGERKHEMWETLAFRPAVGGMVKQGLMLRFNGTYIFSPREEVFAALNCLMCQTHVLHWKIPPKFH